MDDLYSVSDLAEAIAASKEPERLSLVIRRLRHWSVAGIMPTADGAFKGGGRHRRYDRDALYLAAILNVLADQGLGLGELQKVSQRVLQQSDKNPLSPNKQWTRFLYDREFEKSTHYIIFDFSIARGSFLSTMAQDGEAFGFFTLSKEILTADLDNYIGVGSIVINVSALFAGISP